MRVKIEDIEIKDPISGLTKKETYEAIEDVHQRSFTKWAFGHPILSKYYYHVPNEGKRPRLTGHLLTLKGLRKGVSDIVIAYPSPQGYHGAYLELKRPMFKDRVRNVLSVDQTEWIDSVKKVGYYANVAWGWEDAREQALKYLAGTLDKV